MKNKWIICSLTLLIIGGCKKDSSLTSCNQVTTDYYLPDSLYTWFNKVMGIDSSSKNFYARSNTGLSETMVASRFATSSSGSGCENKIYHQNTYTYLSNTFRNYFRLSVNFENQSTYPNGWNSSNFDLQTDKISLYIHFDLLNNSNNCVYDVDLKQALSPTKSNKMNVAYYTYDSVPFKTTLMTCDSCIQEIGNYSQNGKSYNEVCKYISPLNFGNPRDPLEFLVDKKFGVIQFKTKDGTTWTIDNF
ncbi:MAG: hypothetical protein ACHQK8_01255 [Bacteroidia bacterium]